MTAVNGKLFFVIMMMMLALSWAQNFGDSEVPSVLSYNSPLRQPDSLRSRPYFDFLSTLYRHDSEKSSLFKPYLQRVRREAVAPAPAAVQTDRSRRAIVFRPLFVYKQQEIRKQQVQVQEDRSRRV